MKPNPLFLFCLLAVPSVNAQKYVVEKQNGAKVEYLFSKVRSISFSNRVLRFTSTTGVQTDLPFSNWKSLQLVEAPSNIADTKVYEEVTLSPNPAKESTVLEFPETPLSNAYCSLVDLSGTCLLHLPIVDSRTAIPLSRLSSGTYFVVISIESQMVKTLKLIKQ